VDRWDFFLLNFWRIMNNLNCMTLVVVLSAMMGLSLLPHGSGSALAGMAIVESPKEVKWAPAAGQFLPGAQLAVLAGDPAKPGLYTIRFKMPAGYKVSPHWHPADVDVTVLTGTLGIAMGDKFDEHDGQFVKAGGFVVEPKQMHHYVWADGPTVLQLHGEGPLVINYVNPADDPSTRPH
jgi:hypothetical protein